MTPPERFEIAIYAVADLALTAGIAFVAVETDTPGLFVVSALFLIAGLQLLFAVITGRGNWMTRYIINDADRWGG